MSDHENEIDRAFREGTPIDDALREGVRDALLQHKREGRPIVAWRDGRVVWIPADQIPVAEEKRSA